MYIYAYKYASNKYFFKCIQAERNNLETHVWLYIVILTRVRSYYHSGSLPGIMKMLFVKDKNTHPVGAKIIDHASEDCLSTQRYSQIVQTIFEAWYFCNNNSNYFRKQYFAQNENYFY